MALSHRFGYSVIRPAGTIAPLATVKVVLTGTSMLASIFADVNGITPLANPFTTDVNGFYSYYADPANGDLDEQFSGGGIVTPYTLTAVLGIDPRTTTNASSIATLTANLATETTKRTTGDLNLQKAGVRYPLGGSINVGQIFNGRVDAYDAVVITIDGTRFAGYTLTILVNLKTDGAGTSVTPYLRNITTAADVGNGSSMSAQTPATQSFTATITAGVNQYKLQLLASNAVAAVYGEGYAQLAA